MEAIGKKINYIKLHDFLDRIEVKQVYSTLHTFYNTLISISSMNSEGIIEWAGNEFTKESLMKALKEEEGKLTHIHFGEHPSKKLEVKLQFQSGNEFVIKVENQDQFAMILQFLFDYK